MLASLAKIQQKREKQEAELRRAASMRGQTDEDDDDAEFGGPEPGFDVSFVSKNAGMSKRELEGLNKSPIQLLEQQQREDAIIEKGPGGSAAIGAATPLEPAMEVHADTKNLCGRLSPDGTYLALGCADGSVRLVNSHSGRTAFQHDPGLAHRTVKPAVTCLRFRPATGGDVHNLVAFCTSDGQVVHWHATSGNVVGKRVQEDLNNTFCLDYRADGAHFATAGLDRKVRLYDAATHQLVCSLAADPADNSTMGHADRVFSVKYTSRDDDLLISGGWDDTVYVWDGRCGRAVRSFFGPHICGDALDFDEGRAQVLTGSWREREALQVWDLGTGELADTLPWRPAEGQPPCYLYAAMFGTGALSRFIAAGGSKSNEVRLVERERGRPVARFAGLPSAVTGLDLMQGDAPEPMMAVICETAAYCLALPH